MCVVLTGCGLHHSTSWKLADLDRNRFNLGLSRGADTGVSLAEWVDHGEVIEASGSAGPGEPGDLRLLVSYEISDSSWSGGGTHLECYVFTSTDGDTIAFHQAECPTAE